MKVFGRYLILMLLVIISGTYSVQVFAAQNLWKDIPQLAAKSKINILDNSPESKQDNNEQSKNKISSENHQTFKNARLLQLDIPQMQVLLSASLSKGTELNGTTSANKSVVNKDVNTDFASQQSTSQIDLPLPGGRFITVQAISSKVLPESLANKYPDIKTFKLIPDENIISGRVDMTPSGFHGMLQMRDGETVFIDPVSQNILNQSQQNRYASYRKNDQQIKTGHEGHQCLLDKESSSHLEAVLSGSSSLARSELFSNTSSNKTASRSVEHLLQYRIAIAATGEYTTIKGGKSAALSAIATTLNRVNQVYEQDLGIHLSLVENNDEIIFTDADSDPYITKDLNKLISINQGVIDSLIGTGNYDLGHLFTTSGGGLAIIGSVCNDNSKAMGISGTANPGNDSFTLDFVAHEIGHQIGATHTFNGSEGLCSGNTRTDRTAFEPGSGSTIMSYAGICGSDNLQSHADAMFHIGSIEQIRAYTQSGNGSRCGIRATHSNEPPNPEAGKNYVIPANTPFELNGSAVDPDGDRLVYAWEQIDAGSSSQQFEDKGNNALFRAHLPNQSSSRTFPPLGNIISRRISRGENLPIRERVLRFKFVSQDGYNSAQSDEMSISVKRTGSRFALDLPRSHYTLGRDYRIGWNVANTDQAPIHCDNVDITLSTDGGYNFNHVLAEGVPNTGEAWIYLSSSLPETSRARLKLECRNNIFFAISANDFRLTFADIEDAPEPGPEPDLRDSSISQTNSSTTAISTSSGGGILNPLWLLILVSYRFLRKLV